MKWYVNDEYVTSSERLEIESGNEERKLDIYAEVLKKDKIYYTNVFNIFVTENFDLTRKIYDFIEENNIKTAISVGIKSPSFSYILNEGYSFVKKKEKNDKNTLHFTYSMTKSFTAMIVLYLAKHNYISLDEKISKYLDLTNYIFVNSDVKIRDLLMHTSGINDYLSNMALYYNNPFINAEWNPYILLNYIESPFVEPGIYMYSSTNYIILGLLIEKVTGKKINVVFDELIFTPLSLNNTYLLPQDNLDLNLISHPNVYPYTDFSLVGDGINPIDISLMIPNYIDLVGKCSWSAGGVVSNITDILNWGYELFNGDFLDSNLREEFLRSVDIDGSETDEIYGYGIRKIFYNDDYFIGSYGRSFGSENCMFYNPKNKVCIVILSSSNSSKTGNPDIDKLLFSLYEIVNSK